MAISSARGKQPPAVVQQRSKHAKSSDEQVKMHTATAKADEKQQQLLVDAHLPPLFLTLVILACSGFCFVFCLRDFLSTGKNIGGAWDEAMLVCILMSEHAYQ